MILALACAHAGTVPISASTPSPPPEPVPMHEPIYRDWLGTQGIEDAKVREGQPPLAGWNFYTVDSPGGWPDHAAAVGPGKLLAGRDAPAGWRALLQVTPVEQLAIRVAWLLGNPVVLGAGDPVETGAVIVPPLVTEPDPGTSQLTMWVGWPPAVSTPFRVQVTARSDGTVVIDEKHWSEVR